MGMTIPAEYGGRGASYLQAVVLIEEMAKACSATGRICVESNMGALGAIMKYGSEAQKRLAAALVLAGDKPAILITEPEAGSAATEMTTRADYKGDRYVLNGQKHWITGGGVSRLHLVFARMYATARSRASPASSWCGTRTRVRRKDSSSASASPRWACAASPRPRSSSRISRSRRTWCWSRPGRAQGLRRADGRLQRAAGRRGDGCARHRRERLRARARLCPQAPPVRPPDRRVPGDPVDARRHVDPARRRPRAHLQGGGRRRRRLPRQAGGGRGQGLRVGDGGARHQRCPADSRRHGVLAQPRPRAQGARCADVPDRGRHGPDPAHPGGGAILGSGRRSARRLSQGRRRAAAVGWAGRHARC